jgi:hypothetical protein
LCQTAGLFTVAVLLPRAPAVSCSARSIAGLAAGVVALVLGLLAYRRSGQKSA